MSDIAEHLIEFYYSKYKGPRQDVVPTVEEIEFGYRHYKDHFIIVRDDRIRGIAIFLTLSDETYIHLEKHDITKIDILSMLLQERGENIHFVLLCADGMKTIWEGIKEIKSRIKPKTISWWNPDLNKLHKYNLRS